MVASSIDQAIHEALEAADRLLARGEPFPVIADAYQRVAGEYLSQLRDPSRRDILRRRVADAMFVAALARDVPVDRCEALLRDCLAAGFDTLLARALAVYGFCGYCASAGHAQMALKHLLPLVDELEEEHLRTGAEPLRRALEACRKLLERISPGHPRATP